MAKRSATPDADTPILPGAEPRIYLFHGKEAFLRLERTSDIRAGLEKAHGGVDLFNFDGATCSAADVLDECRSFGLMAGHKLVIVDNAEDLIKEDVRPLFERYAQAPSEGATLVLRSESWRAGKLDKMIEAVGVIEKCEPLPQPAALKWIAARVRKPHKAKIDPKAADLLFTRVGSDLAKLDSELSKLASAAGPDQTITVEIVDHFVGPSREEQVWGIQATLLSSGPEDGLLHLRYVLDISRQPAQLVLYAMLDLARKLHAVARGVKSGANPNDLSNALKLWGPSKAVILDIGYRMPPERALRLLRACVQADLRSKTGLGDIERTLERLVVQYGRALGHPAQPRADASR